MFKSCQNKGFHITFKNGITVSVQFGYGNYCNPLLDFERQDWDKIGTEKDEKLHESHNAEVAVWGKDGEFITKQYPKHRSSDDVAGWLNPSEVLDIMNWASALQVDEPIS